MRSIAILFLVFVAGLFLGGEFRAGVEIARLFRAILWPPGDGKAVQMGFVAGGQLHRAAFHFDEAVRFEPLAQRRLDAAPAQKERAAIGVDIGVPERARFHVFP